MYDQVSTYCKFSVLRQFLILIILLPEIISNEMLYYLFSTLKNKN